jgi:transcriptional regulator GlxA family with amidase domain
MAEIVRRLSLRPDAWHATMVAMDRTIADCRGRIDTLIVAGGTGSRPAQDDEELIAWLGAAARRSRRVASVCTGALLLGSAGLLDGRRVTTHWAWCDCAEPFVAGWE